MSEPTEVLYVTATFGEFSKVWRLWMTVQLPDNGPFYLYRDEGLPPTLFIRVPDDFQFKPGYTCIPRRLLSI